MSSLTRHQTEKVGVFYVLGKPRAKSRDDTTTGKPDKIFYIMYRLDGKKIEEKVGRESERMTAAKIREQRAPRKPQGRAIHAHGLLYRHAARRTLSPQMDAH